MFASRPRRFKVEVRAPERSAPGAGAGARRPPSPARPLPGWMPEENAYRTRAPHGPHRPRPIETDLERTPRSCRTFQPPAGRPQQRGSPPRGPRRRGCARHGLGSRSRSAAGGPRPRRRGGGPAGRRRGRRRVGARVGPRLLEPLLRRAVQRWPLVLGGVLLLGLPAALVGFGQGEERWAADARVEVQPQTLAAGAGDAAAARRFRPKRRAWRRCSSGRPGCWATSRPTPAWTPTSGRGCCSGWSRRCVGIPRPRPPGRRPRCWRPTPARRG